MSIVPPRAVSLLRQARSSIARVASTARRLTRRRGWLEIGGAADDVTVKPVDYLPVYEEFMGGLRTRRFSLLELGIHKADSLAMWRDAFPRATIVGIDLAPPDVDLGPRVHLVKGDQADAELLHRVAAQYAPGGFEVIIDDASHVGQLTARSLQALYGPHLRSGGFYFIEDWATGYVPPWPDAADPTMIVGAAQLDDAVEVRHESGDGTGLRLASHDYGMVGLVKRLIDHTAVGPLTLHQPDWVAETLPIEWIRINGGLVVLKKS